MDGSSQICPGILGAFFQQLGWPLNATILVTIAFKCCEPSRELHAGVSRALRDRNPKSEKSLPGPLAAGSQKVSKKSRTDICSRLFPDFSDFFENFSRLFGTPGLGAPGDFFQTVLGFRARRAGETPVARGRVRNSTG